MSIVIPTYREQVRLPACLHAVGPQARAHGAELIVVDGGSDDATVEIARSEPGARVLTSERGRAAQMNVGARAARGSLLLFLHADSILPEGAVARLRRIDRDGDPLAGGFRMRFDADRLWLRGVARLHNLRAGLTHVVYGDQAPFVRRELFLRLGGYRTDRPMEDLEFGRRLRRHVRPRLLELTTTTSARRFDRHGDLQATAEGARILFHWTFLRRLPDSSIYTATIREPAGESEAHSQRRTDSR